MSLWNNVVIDISLLMKIKKQQLFFSDFSNIFSENTDLTKQQKQERDNVFH